jgi:hypothetical protein
MRTLLLLPLLSGTAIAQPAADDVRVNVDVQIDAPGSTPTQPTPAPAPAAASRYELSVHAGAVYTSESYGLPTAGEGYAIAGPHGANLVVDGGAAVHVKPWLSMGGVASVSSVSSDNVPDALYGDGMMATVTNRFYDLGARARLHAGGGFIGGVVAIEVVSANDGGHHRHYAGMQTGLELGYRAHVTSGPAPELLLEVTHTSVAAGTEIVRQSDMTVTASIASVRAMVGVVF